MKTKKKGNLFPKKYYKVMGNSIWSKKTLSLNRLMNYCMLFILLPAVSSGF